MTKTVTISEASVKSRIKVHLSVIGRRLNQKAGDKNYQNVTLSSNEDGLVDDYFKGAMACLAGQLPEVLVSYDEAAGTQGYDDAGRSNKAQQDALAGIVASYAISYTIASYLAMTYPELAKKYQQEAASCLIAARNVVYAKTRPAAATASFLDWPKPDGGKKNDDAADGTAS